MKSQQNLEGSPQVKGCQHNPGEVWEDGCCGNDAIAHPPSKTVISQTSEESMAVQEKQPIEVAT